jgi:hypothetical protein
MVPSFDVFLLVHRNASAFYKNIAFFKANHSVSEVGNTFTLELVFIVGEEKVEVS